jgi:hypothetical protein
VNLPQVYSTSRWTFNSVKLRDYESPRLVEDRVPDTIRQVNLNTGIITTVLGAGVRGDGPETNPLQCKLSRPHGLWAAPDGALYVTDSEAHRIRVLRA